jgi:hypothetical protein
MRLEGNSSRLKATGIKVSGNQEVVDLQVHEAFTALLLAFP